VAEDDTPLRSIFILHLVFVKVVVGTFVLLFYFVFIVYIVVLFLFCSPINSKFLFNQCLSPLMLWVRISIWARCTTLCDKVCQWLATGWWFSPGPPVSSTNKTDRHDITELLLKVALNTIKQTDKQPNSNNSTTSLTADPVSTQIFTYYDDKDASHDLHISFLLTNWQKSIYIWISGLTSFRASLRSSGLWKLFLWISCS
jgi:hypothetical protein